MSIFTKIVMIVIVCAIYHHNSTKGLNLPQRSLLSPPSNVEEADFLKRSVRQVDSRLTDRVQLCDRRLLEELTKLCKGRFPTYAKRSSAENLFTRHRRAITQECCLKPCTRSYLRTFCATQHPTTTLNPPTSTPKPNSAKNPFELMRELKFLLEKTRSYSNQPRVADIPNNSENEGNEPLPGIASVMVFNPGQNPDLNEEETINNEDDGPPADAIMTDEDLSSIFFIG